MNQQQKKHAVRRVCLIMMEKVEKIIQEDKAKEAEFSDACANFQFSEAMTLMQNGHARWKISGDHKLQAGADLLRDLLELDHSQTSYGKIAESHGMRISEKKNRYTLASIEDECFRILWPHDNNIVTYYFTTPQARTQLQKIKTAVMLIADDIVLGDEEQAKLAIEQALNFTV